MKRILRAWVMAWALLPAAAAVGQGVDLESYLLSKAKTLPPPDWLKEGARLTYYSACATIAGSTGYYYLDEHGKLRGSNKDDKDKKYSRGDAPTASGEGCTQIDVIALGDKVVTNTTSLGFFNGAFTSLGATAAVGPPGAAGQWWVDPRQLLGVQPVNTKELLIQPMPYKIGDNAYNTVRFESHSKDGDLGSNWDLATGVLVFSHISATSCEQKFTWSGDTTSLSQNTFLGVRQRQIPWANAAPPAWIATVKHFQYEGTKTTTIAAPDTGPISLPVSFAFDVKDRGRNWLLCVAGDSMTMAFGHAQVGGLWIPPAAIPGLAVGTMLDKDPFTGAEARVTFNGTLPTGARVVVIREDSPGHSNEFTYDAVSGVLQAMRMENKSFAGVIEVTEVHLTQVN